jgi:fatty-acyl-CoA synthase/long-chain acyl-CoA synthetase
VLGSGVIGRPDPDKGQVPVAFLRVKSVDGAAPSQDEMAAWCRTRMATYKVPEIRIVETLPMTATGKVKKEQLQQML